MSTLAYQEIRSFARDRVKNAANTKKVLSIALGIALSRSIQLPSSEAIDGYTHYADTVSYAVCEGAARFNENIVVDMDLVESTARAFWLKRYFSAYPMKVIPLMSEDEGHFMNKLSGVGHLVNPNTFVTCQDESPTIIALVNRIRALEPTVALESEGPSLADLVRSHNVKLTPIPGPAVGQIERTLGIHLSSEYKHYLETFGHISYGAHETFGASPANLGHLDVVGEYADLKGMKGYPASAVPLMQPGWGSYFLYDNAKKSVVEWSHENGQVHDLNVGLAAFLIKTIFG